MEESELDQWKLFLKTNRSPVLRDKYSTMVVKFLHFVQRRENLKTKLRTLATKNGQIYKLNTKLYFGN
jgi:hypothetical protein